jgi:hypothetical protein
MRRAQTSAAFSSNGNILPLNSECGPSTPANHASNRSRFLPFGLSSMPRRISAIDCSDRQGGDEQIAIGLHTHLFQQRFGRVRLRYIADNVCVEKVAGQRPTLRPVSLERANSRSAPTSGDRRSASRIPPLFGGSPEIVRPMADGRWRIGSGPNLGHLPRGAARRSGSSHDLRRVRAPRIGRSPASSDGSDNFATLASVLYHS